MANLSIKSSNRKISKLNLGQTLIAIDKLDVGLHKKGTLCSYVKRAFSLGLQDGIDIISLSKLSPKAMNHEKFQLGNE